MRPERTKPTLRCAVYTRVSTEHGLEQEFNSLDNQREASEAYVKSQAHEGWRLIRTRYDDGGYSGGSIIVVDDPDQSKFRMGAQCAAAIYVDGGQGLVGRTAQDRDPLAHLACVALPAEHGEAIFILP